MTTARDLKLKRRQELAAKQDTPNYIRAVIVDSLGNQTGNNSIWQNQSTRRVWYMAMGANQAAHCRCVRIQPHIGLGVIIGHTLGSSDVEVLSDDPFLRDSNTTGTSYPSPGPEDFGPNGRLQLWLYTKMITPLATYPTGAMLLTTMPGDYIYRGLRVTFPGVTGTDLSASIPAAGLHRLVGLYLDDTNTLQTIDGASVALASTPPEPVWPADAYRLCVVLVSDTDTAIDFDNLTDRRINWTDPISDRDAGYNRIFQHMGA